MDQNCSSRGHPWAHKQVIDELIHGREAARQLQLHLNTPSSSPEALEVLVNQILTSYDKSVSLLSVTGNWNGNESNREPQASGGTGIGSPRSEDSDREFKDSEQTDCSKKRKGSYVETWKQQVKVRPESGVEELLDDGYSWRKYGQKDILGAKHPRGYYRCTYRQVQGCFATKQIQRSEEDPTIFDITYRGRHTCCNPDFHTIPLPPSPPPALAQTVAAPPPPSLPNIQHSPRQNQILQSPEILLNFQTGLKVITKNLDTPPFSFPSTSNNSFIFPTLENNFQDNFSPSFISPATSRSTYFSMSPPRMSEVKENPNVVIESELNELVSAVTSSTSSPTFGIGFPFEELHFGFDN